MRVRKLNNEGSSLVTIILCLIFVSMLGMLILDVTFFNVRIKQKEQIEKAAFYHNETALNEITTGITQAAIESIQESYIEVLEVYATSEYQKVDYSTGKTVSDEAKIMDYYYTRCTEHFKEKLGLPAIGKTDSEQLSQLMKQFVVSNVGHITVEQTANFLIQTVSGSTYAEKEAIISDVQVVFHKDGRSSTISTDLVVAFPALDFTALETVNRSFDLPYKEYAIIAEGGILTENGTSTITGNVYAGDAGIVSNMDDTKLFLYGNELITRGSLTAKNRSRIQVGSLKERVNVWAKDLVTEADTSYTLSPTTLLLDGKSKYSTSKYGVNCYIEDDLMLNAAYSDVSIEGDYIGYSTVDAASPNESGSSIVINGAQSKLKIAGDILALGGYSYISFQQNLLGDENRSIFQFDETSAEEKALILTGESVGIKSNQYLYLVPDSYMVTKSNPIPYAEYANYVEKGKSLVMLDSLRADYKNSKIDVIPVIYSTFAGADKVVYFYMNFTNAKEAIQFFQTNTELFPSNWYLRGANIFKLKLVELNSKKIYSVGNVMDYKLDSLGNVTQTVKSIKDFQSFTSVNDMEVSQLPSTYQLLSKVLKQELDVGEVVEEDTTPFTYYIDAEKVAADEANQTHEGVAYTYNRYMLNDYSVVDVDKATDYKYHIVITNGDYVCDQMDRGLIVANGDVDVRREFQGLIFANGQVTISDSAKVTYDAEMVQDILYHAEEELLSYFKQLTSTNIGDNIVNEEDSKEMNLDELVTYRNWKSY